ncbi:MAG: cysteine synthase family protein [Holophaga sp.]|nr:cysteine synthase family protein [Holophaga sp.]
MPPAIATSVLETIGNTPMLRVSRIDTGPCELFLKLENQNPGGSIKDRIALSIIQEAERDGRLKPGGTLVEATAGNTGLGLALVGRAKGYPVVLVVPDKMAEEKVLQLRALGAEIHLTRSDVGKDHPDYYQNVAARLAASVPGAFYTDQFTNPANPKAHEETTGPEILAQMGGNLDAVVCGVGSGGTLAGLTHCFRGRSLPVAMVLADPEGSVLAPWIREGHVPEAGSWAVEGIGEDYLPPQADFGLVSRAYAIGDQESFQAARLLLEAEGILAGSSTGTLLAAALRYCREQTTPKRVVTFVCDTGTRYLSKVYSPVWMRRRGWDGAERFGDLRDFAVRRFQDGTAPMTVAEDLGLAVLKRFEATGLPSLPVFQGMEPIGMIESTRFLLSINSDPKALTRRAEHLVAPEVPMLDSGRDFKALVNLLEHSPIALLTHQGQPFGLIAPLDLAIHPKENR